MRVLITLALFLLITFTGNSFANGDNGASGSDVRLFSSELSVSELRTLGQQGLDRLLDRYSREITQFNSGGSPENWDKIASKIDQVSAQKDAYSSGLFWYRDIEKAKAAARNSNRGVISLRLLGNLDDEYSCANSRFFRTILYSDPSIQKALKENYVLHWSSERAAPKITIDFGDGRKLVRTITGNSIHYVIKSDGEIVDALPGLYSPDRFRKALISVAAVARSKEPFKLRGVYHAGKSMRLLREWERQLEKPAVLPQTRTELTNKRVSAVEVAPIAVTKMVTELPALLSTESKFKELNVENSIDQWKPMARKLKVELSPESISLIRRKTSALSKTEFDSLVAKLREYIALDTVQNEFQIRPQILQRLGAKRTVDFEELNRWVYSTLFKTPQTDSWLGLYEKDIYYAIENNGVID